MVLVNTYWFTLPQGGADAYRFHRLATLLAEFPQYITWDLFFHSGLDAIVSMAAVIYQVTGPHMIIMGLLMACLGTVVVYYTYQLVLEVTYSRRAAYTAGLAATFFPQLALHSALFLRETPVNLTFLIAVYYAVLFIKRQNILYLVVAGCVAILSTAFHSGMFAFFIGLGLFFTFYNPGARRSTGFIKKIAACLLVFGFVYFLNTTSYGLSEFGGELDGIVEEFEQSEARDPRGGLAYPGWLRIRGGFVSNLWKFPIRIVAFVFSPLIPFMIRHPGHLFGAIDAILYMYLIGYWLKYRKLIFRHKLLAMQALTVAAVLVFFSFGVSNAGTAIRHRAKSSPVLIALVVSTHYLIKIHRRRQRHLSNRH